MTSSKVHLAAKKGQAACRQPLGQARLTKNPYKVTCSDCRVSVRYADALELAQQRRVHP